MNNKFRTGIDWFCPRGCQVFTPKLRYAETPECGFCGSSMTTDDAEYGYAIESIERNGIDEIVIMDEYRKAVAIELSDFLNLDLGMAEAVVLASPSDGYMRRCLAEGYDAARTARGFNYFIEKFLIDLVANSRIEVSDNNKAELDEIPFP